MLHFQDQPQLLFIWMEINYGVQTLVILVQSSTSIFNHRKIEVTPMLTIQDGKYSLSLTIKSLIVRMSLKEYSIQGEGWSHFVILKGIRWDLAESGWSKKTFLGLQCLEALAILLHNKSELYLSLKFWLRKLKKKIDF